MFYLSGFDPRGGRFYHTMHSEELAKHASLTGTDVAISRRQKGENGTLNWTVDCAGVSHTQFTVLPWDDLVRRAWVTNPLKLAGQSLSAYWAYLWRQDWASFWRLAIGPCICMLYPVVTVTVLPLLLMAVFAAILGLVMPVWLAIVLGLIAAVLVVRPVAEKIRAIWLIRLFLYNHTTAVQGFEPALMARLDAFAQMIADALDAGDDEVVLVGHSNGSILAVPLLLKLLALRGRPLPENFSLLTLSHCIPILSCRRDALQFRAMQQELSRHPFAWVDIGCPPDGAGCCMVDPLQPTSDHGAIQLTCLSAKFFQFYDPKNYHSGYANKYELHFDYWRCGDRVSPIDLPSLTTAARPLAESVAAFNVQVH